MKFKKLFLSTLSLLLIAGVTSCGEDPSNSSPTSNDPNPSTTTTSDGGTTTTKPTDPTTPPSISINEDSNYDQDLLKWSKKDHLYIHYTRGNNTTISDYSNYLFWIWEASPFSGDGGIYGNSTDVAGPSGRTYYSNKLPYMSNIGGSGNSVDEAGVCLEIDLNHDYINGYGKVQNFSKSTKLGFLVVDESSMSGASHWKSDGGSDTFFSLEQAKKENGSYHIFLVSGAVTTPRFNYNDKQIENPVSKDETGEYETKSNISNSSTTSYGRSITSELFYSKAGVGYQIFVPSFADSNGDGIGDLRGVINKLDYLKSLNVTNIWLTPFLECNSYHGYDTVDYFNVDPRFGTNQDFAELTYKAHEKGMLVLMDLVINHASTAGDIFQKAQRAAKGVDLYGNEFEYRNMFHFLYKGSKTPAGSKVEDNEDWYRDGESNYFYYAKFGSSMPDFNYDYKYTRDYVDSIAKYWLGKGVDGFRLDAIKHIYMADEVSHPSSDKILSDISERTYYDEQLGKLVTKTQDYSTNETKNVAFWKEFATRIKTVYPSCYLVGENLDGWDERMAPLYECMDSQFDFNSYYHNTEYIYLHGPDGPYGATNAGKLALATDNKLNKIFTKYNDKPINSAFTSNHDILRAINQINATKNGSEYVVPKISGTATEINKAKIHAAITILQPGNSFIYYGDELGMSSNTTENKLGHTNHIDRYYRQSMKWKNEEERPLIKIAEGITTKYDSYNAKLDDVETQEKDSSSMLNFYKAITKIKSDPSFPINGKYKGYEISSNASILHYDIASNSTTTKSYKVFIHTAGGGTNTYNYSIPSGYTSIYKYNATDTSISPFGIVVLKSN